MVIRTSLRFLLKMVNSFLAIFGIAAAAATVWIFKISNHPPSSWFIYTIVGFGAFLCTITCWGHIAAHTGNGCLLYCYLVLIFSLLMLETAVSVDVFLNPNWEKDFPKDPSGNFHEFKDFIKENIRFCRWVGVVILSVEGLCVFLTVVLLALGPNRKGYDSKVEYTQEGGPLLKNYSNKFSYIEKQVNMRPLHSGITW